MGLSQGFIVDEDVDMGQKRAMVMVSNCAKRLIETCLLLRARA